MYEQIDLNLVSYKDTPFYNRKVQITGTFSCFTDREVGLKAVLKELGAVNEKSESYVKRIDVLVAGEGPGPAKIRRAQTDGKLIIYEEELYEILCKAGKLN